MNAHNAIVGIEGLTKWGKISQVSFGYQPELAKISTHELFNRLHRIRIHRFKAQLEQDQPESELQYHQKRLWQFR